MKCKTGDRVRLIHMVDDPNPIPTGATGTVMHVNELSWGPTQISVSWDNGRALMLLDGVDQFEVI